MTTKVLFLDFDGVICIYDKTKKDSLFSKEQMDLVENACRETGASIVISSDHRHMTSEEEINSELSPGLVSLLHPDKYTKIKGHRWNEVEEWLSRHPEITHYTIVDDFQGHFEGAPESLQKRIVYCIYSVGISTREYPRIITHLTTAL